MIDNSEKWKDISGDPLIDVNIQVKGTTRGATTDFDGEFEIEADLQDTLLFSYVGYKTLSVAIDGRTRRSEEHTSELQSRGHLVCRLLLEKKKDSTTESLRS